MMFVGKSVGRSVIKTLRGPASGQRDRIRLGMGEGSKLTILQEQDGHLCVHFPSIARNHSNELDLSLPVSAVFLLAGPLLLSVHQVLMIEQSSDIDLGFKFIMSSLVFGLCFVVTLVSVFRRWSHHVCGIQPGPSTCSHNSLAMYHVYITSSWAGPVTK